MLATVFSAAAPAAAADVKNPDTFVYALAGAVDTLDPHWQFDGVSHAVTSQVYETLVGFRGGSVEDFEPLLAGQVPGRDNGLLSADGRHYAFPVRKGVTFHDGTPLTPEDVKYSLMRFLLMDRDNGPSAMLLEPLLGVETVRGVDGRPDKRLYALADERIAIEGGAVVLRLPQPYPPLLSILAAFAPIVSKKWAAAQGGWDGRLETWDAFFNPPKGGPLHALANGTGPFRLEAWDAARAEVRLERHDGYWRAPAALKRAVFRRVEEPGLRQAMLRSGEADAIVAERGDLAGLDGAPGVSVIDDLPALAVSNVLVMNWDIQVQDNPLANGLPADFFADADVRKGFAYAFDYEALLRESFAGRAERARGPIPRGVFGYNPRQQVYLRDPVRAADHLKKARMGAVWRDGFTLTLAYAEGRADREAAGRIMKRSIEALNPKFKVELRGLPQPAWLAAWRSRKIPMAVARWHMDYPDPHNAVYPFLHSEGYFAKTQRYANARADRFVDRAKREADRDQRRRLYAELQAFAFADVPQIYTFDVPHVQALRSWVRGWEYNPLLPYGRLYDVRKN